eukprot:CAMPEP_0168512610 /NCGR_PEP_ID=MMETSP0405-20121227/2908_1 /TAXON_ID=498012 /ORGANISM="Trichosphaerium sp, Strain Am-I-7 wt" /LENGTH=397 /DNA_ID=CAMNT_0008531161 /DNA_START=57 /DNA_END=1250 /DNA_ORIENTATION=-
MAHYEKPANHTQTKFRLDTAMIERLVAETVISDYSLSKNEELSSKNYTYYDPTEYAYAKLYTHAVSGILRLEDNALLARGVVVKLDNATYVVHACLISGRKIPFILVYDQRYDMHVLRASKVKIEGILTRRALSIVHDDVGKLYIQWKQMLLPFTQKKRKRDDSFSEPPPLEKRIRPRVITAARLMDAPDTADLQHLHDKRDKSLLEYHFPPESYYARPLNRLTPDGGMGIRNREPTKEDEILFKLTVLTQKVDNLDRNMQNMEARLNLQFAKDFKDKCEEVSSTIKSELRNILVRPTRQNSPRWMPSNSRQAPPHSSVSHSLRADASNSRAMFGPRIPPRDFGGQPSVPSPPHPRSPPAHLRHRSPSTLTEAKIVPSGSAKQTTEGDVPWSAIVLS